MALIFENIDSKNKYKLLHSFRADIHNIKENESIIKIVNENNILCLITKGSLNLIRHSVNGNDFIIEIIEENNIIGPSLYNLNNIDYDLIANEETEIITMNYSDVINYRGKNKKYDTFMKNIFVIINSKMKEQSERINILTKKGIRNKLLEYFEIIYRKNNSRNIYLPFTFSLLADYLGIDRSAMTRELKYLKEEGFIKITGKRITLLYK